MGTTLVRILFVGENQTKAVFNELTAELHKIQTEVKKTNSQPVNITQNNTVNIKALQQYTQNINQAGTATKVFQSIFAGTFLGNLASGGVFGAISTISGGIQDLSSIVFGLSKKAIQLGADFESTVNSMTVFTGSARKAKLELADLAELAANTPGLSFESSIQGAKNLRALGFTAKVTQDLVAGLAKQKLLTGADEGAVNRVIVNLTQLASGSPRMSQDIKEMVQSMRGLRPVIVDTFGSMEKFKAALSKDPDSALEKFAKGLADAKGAASGLNGSWSKLTDELEKGGISAATPFIPELTENIKSLTNYLRENKDSWRIWGEELTDSITGVGIAARITKQYLMGMPSAKQQTEDDYRLGTRLIVGGISPALGFAAMLKKQVDPSKPNESAEAEANRKLVDLSKEAGVILDNRRRKAEAIRERERANELSTLQKTGSEAEAILKNRYQVQQAQRDSYIRLTSQDELNFLRESATAQSNYYNSESARAAAYFNRQIELNSGNDIEIAKITSEKNKTLSNLDRERQVAAFQNQKKIQEQERQILEERRQAAIEFKSLEIQEINSFAGYQENALRRSMEMQTIGLREGYAELIEITDNSYTETLRLQTESYALQLANVKLTAEERKNIEKKQFLDEIGLAEQRKEKRLQIEESLRQGLIQKAQETSRQYLAALSVIGSNQGAFEEFFTPENFSTTAFSKIQKEAQGNFDAKLAEIKEQEIKIAGYITQIESAKTPDEKMTADISRVSTVKLIERLKLEVPSLNNQFSELGKTLAKTFDFDAAGETLLLRRQALEQTEINEKIRENAELRTLAVGDSLLKLQAENNILYGQKQILQNIQEIELERYRQNTKAGLTETLGLLRSGDTGEVERFRQAAQKGILREQIGYYSQSIELEERLATVGEDSAIRYKNAWLSATLEVKEANVRAVEDQIEAQVRLQDNQTLNVEQLRANVMRHMASVTSLTDAWSDAIIDEFDRAADFLEKRLGKLGDLPIIGTLAKVGQRQFLSTITTGLLDTFFPSMAENFKSPMENLYNESKTHTKHLASIDAKLGGNPAQELFNSTSPASFIKSAIGIGGSLSSRNGINNRNIYNANGEISTDASGLSNTITHRDGTTYTADGSNSIFSNLKSLFSTNDGGLFARRTNPFTGQQGSKAAGIAGGIGDLAQLAASTGIFGRGRLSSAIQYAGMGASIGSMFGLVGAGVGAAAGALFGAIFGGTRKQDEIARSQARDLATSELDKIISQLNAKPPQINPPSAARQQADAIIQAYSQAVSTIQDGKTRNIALAELKPNESIGFRSGKVNEAIQTALTYQAMIANNEKFTGQFANGVFIGTAFRNQFDEYKRLNGMLGGTWTGKDYIKALLAEKEMVLNPAQQNAVIKNAGGHDVFAGAGIPNYKRRVELPRYAGGISLDATPNISTPSFAPVSAARPQINITNHFTITGAENPEKLKAEIKSFIKETTDAALDEYMDSSKAVQKTGQNMQRYYKRYIRS